MSLATFDEHEADTIHEHQYVNGLTQTSGLGLVTLYALLATFSMIGALTAVFWLDALTGRTFLLVVVHVAMMLPIKFIEHGVVRLCHLIPNRSISTVGQDQALLHSVCEVSNQNKRGRQYGWGLLFGNASGFHRRTLSGTP